MYSTASLIPSLYPPFAIRKCELLPPVFKVDDAQLRLFPCEQGHPALPALLNPLFPWLAEVVLLGRMRAASPILGHVLCAGCIAILHCRAEALA